MDYKKLKFCKKILKTFYPFKMAAKQRFLLRDISILAKIKKTKQNKTKQKTLF